MIKKILKQAATSSLYGFETVESSGQYEFFKKLNGEDKRFLVVHEADKLLKPEEYNFDIEECLPESIKKDPAFEKNTDLVILLNINELCSFDLYEQKIFSIEENPYYFKKYVLYYSQEEIEVINGFNFDDFNRIISDKNSFNLYKRNPKLPTEYSIVARFFIKIPFLEVPVSEESLKDVHEIYMDSINNEGMLNFEEKIDGLVKENLNDYDLVVKEYIRGKMETK